MAAAIKKANPECACCVKIRCFDDTEATVALACMLQVRHCSPGACMLQVHVADTLAVVGPSILAPTTSFATFMHTNALKQASAFD